MARKMKDDRDPYRALAEMAQADPQVLELLELLEQIKIKRGSEGLAEWLREMEDVVARARRDEFRVVKGGRKPRPEASA